MTTEQAFNEVTSKNLWYAGKYNKHQARQIKARFKRGELSENKITEVLTTFGYIKKTTWEKLQ